MSVGHSKKQHDAADELKRIENTDWYRKAMRIERRLYRRYEIPWLGGSSTDTMRIYVDPRFRGTADYCKRQLNVTQLMPALTTHEVVEAILLVFGKAEDGFKYEYDGAHEVATEAEVRTARRVMARLGYPWDEAEYQEIYKPYLKMTQVGPWQNLPQDLNTEPYRDDAPGLYCEIERQMLRGEVIIRVSKIEASYGKGSPEEHCKICSHYVSGGACEIVKGQIDPGAWCRYFEVGT
jgi:hypothetical protein